jgi:hypothetical protein
MAYIAVRIRTRRRLPYRITEDDYNYVELCEKRECLRLGRVPSTEIVAMPRLPSPIY